MVLTQISIYSEVTLSNEKINFLEASIMVDLGNANSVHVNGITNTESHPAIEKKEKNLNDYLLAFRAGKTFRYT